MTLFELTYACRLYGEFTGYDASLRKLRQALGAGPPDLEETGRRKALLVWLNSWGCRQFQVAFHDLASEALCQWSRSWAGALPPWGVSLVDISEDSMARAVEAYKELARRPASPRKRYGPTGAAKVLYALRPDALPPWDAPIRSRLHLDGSSSSYRRYLESVRQDVQGILAEARAREIDGSSLPSLLNRPLSSLPKLIDEYNWVRYTKGCKPPDRNEVILWASWLCEHVGCMSGGLPSGVEGNTRA